MEAQGNPGPGTGRVAFPGQPPAWAVGAPGVATGLARGVAGGQQEAIRLITSATPATVGFGEVCPGWGLRQSQGTLGQRASILGHIDSPNSGVCRRQED